MKRFLICMLLAVLACSLFTAFAEQEGKLLKAEETRYVRLTLEKYGETLTETCEKDSSCNMDLSVLPWTEWEIDAHLIIVPEEGAPDITNITTNCKWKSSDQKYVSVDGNKISVHASSGSYKVTCKVSDMDSNTYSLTVNINVKNVSVPDTDEMRCVALMLLEDEGADVYDHAFGSVGEYVQYNARMGIGKNTERLEHNSFYTNSATNNHLIYSSLANGTILRHNTSSLGEFTLEIFGVKLNGTTYLMFYGNGNTKVKSIEKIEKSLFNKWLSNTLIKYESYYPDSSKTYIFGTGIYADLATAVSHIKGCRTAAFKPYLGNKSFDFFTATYLYDIATNFTGNSVTRYAFSNPEKNIRYYPDSESISVLFGGKITDLSYSSLQGITYGHGQTDEIILGNETISRKLLLGDGADSVTLDTHTSAVAKEIGNIWKGLTTGADFVDYFKNKISLTQFLKGQVQGILLDQLLSGVGNTIADTLPNYICAGRGNDRIHGSDRNDVYLYVSGDGYDQITDLSGNDSIYLMNFTSSGFSAVANEGGYVEIKHQGIPIIEVTIANNNKSNNTGTLNIYIGSPGQTSSPSYCFERKFDNSTNSLNSINYATVACPVDMLILNADGNIVKTLYDGQSETTTTDYGHFIVTQLDDGDYVKAAFFTDVSYSFAISGTGDGTMNCLYGSIDSETGEYHTASITNVPVQDGALYYPTGEFTSDSILDADWDGNGTIDQTIGNTTEITLPEEKITLAYGETLQLDPTVLSDDCGLIWLSNAPDVVTVDENGMLTAVGFGESNVGVAADNGSGAYAICTVTVPEETLSMEDCHTYGLEASYPYTGKVIRPEISVVYKSLRLTEGVDYCLTYTDHLFPGTATVTVEGAGRFTGSVQLKYLIYEETYSSVEEVVARVAAECEAQGFTTEYDKALWLHDWLVHHANYDYTYTYYYADGVLLKKTGVCQSYTLAYQLLLDAVGIENDTIAAPVEMDHTWNVAKIDGEWCHIDCTWDDPGVGGAEDHMYFGMNTELMSRDHDWPESENRHACTSLQNYYYLRMGAECCGTVEEVFACLDRLADAQAADIFIVYTGSDLDLFFPDVFAQWYDANNWKYGIKSSDGSFGDYYANLTLTYTEPWTNYEGFDAPVPCPDFTLSSPQGVYRLSDYDSNGLVLIFGRDGCLNTHGLMDRLHGELSLLNSGGVDVIISLDAAESLEDFDTVRSEYPNFKYAYDGFNDGTMFDFLEAVGDEIYNITYPLVFIINSDGMITYYSSGYVNNVDALVSEAFKTATGHVLPEPRIEIPENLENVTVPDEWRGDALKTLFSLSSGHDGTLFLYDYRAEYSKTIDTLESWTRKKALVDKLNLRLAVCYVNISDDVLAQFREAYPDVTFIPDDDRVMWEMLDAVGWDMSQPAYYLGGYLIDSDGYIIDYRNGDIYSTQETISRFAFTNDLMFTIPSGLTTIDSDTFSGIAAASVDLTTASLRAINDRAFSDCPNLTLIRIPSSVIHIADSAFDGFTNVTFICDYGSAAYEYALAYNIPCITRY